MAGRKKVEDDILIKSYERLNNIWLVGEEVGLCGQSVWERLKRLDKITNTTRNVKNKFEDWDILKEKYSDAVKEKDGLKKLALQLGRTKNFLCRKAKELGITDIKRDKQEHIGEILSVRMKDFLKENEHPKGMLGKKHTEENKKLYSERSKLRWADPNYILNGDEYRQKLSDRMIKSNSFRNNANPYSRGKRGWVDIAGKNHFYRSSWEANFAAYLEFLKENKEITEWEYEPETFWFEKIKRGVRSYMPDFKITNTDGSTFFYEVKGWMDDKSKTKLNRMRIYHPTIRIQVIDSKRYKEISKNSALYKYWGGLDAPKK